MAKHKYQKALARLLREIVNYAKNLTHQFVRWFTRSFFVTNRRRRSQAGFVLPTIAMMLMVVALVVTAILFRTFTRTEQVIREGQQQAILNAATPAIDRAKSKIEALFTSVDPTSPTAAPTIPDESSLEAELLKTKYTFPDEVTVPNLVNPSTLGKDISGKEISGTTAWKFSVDADGNNTINDKDLTVIYAIVSRAEREGTASIDPHPEKAPIYKNKLEDRSKAFIVPNGPLVSQSGNVSSQCPVPVGVDNPPGWFNATSTASVYKNFQVYAVAVPNALITPGKSTANASIATIEYQQDRKFDRANKWGAWFRTDLEIAPGPVFNWNGAMHSQGNIVVRSQDGFRSFLISSDGSCLYDPPSNSQITLRKDESPLPGGQFITGRFRDNTFDPGTPGGVSVDTSPTKSIRLQQNSAGNNQSLDSVVGGPGQMNIASDPLALHIRGISKPRSESSTNTWQPDTANFWGGKSPLTDGETPRIAQAVSCAPYVDDTYRADNRYGPKPSYSKEQFSSSTGRCEAAPETEQYGTVIQNKAQYTSNDPSGGDEAGETLGLDGYWERRARFNGLRVIVGQRLELGNPFGWNVDLNDDDRPAGVLTPDRNFLNDPDNADRALYTTVNNLTNGRNTGVLPAAGVNRDNEGRQYTTLRDNLAAAQATAVYHYTNQNGGGYFPIAFLATTSHPGTLKTINDSITFKKPQAGSGFSNVFNTRTDESSIFGALFGEADASNEILINFLSGEGTNGWEFNVVPGADGVSDNTETAFVTALGTFSTTGPASTPLGRALENLAHFAGDPDGYFPPKQETSGWKIHPYSKLTMWGNYSNLREVIRLLETGTSYDNLSIADKSTLHTAAGTLGMLAYNISYLRDFDYTTPATPLSNVNKVALNRLDRRLAQLSDKTEQKVFNQTTGALETISASSTYKQNGEVDVNTSTTPAPPATPRIEIYQTNTAQPLLAVQIAANSTAPVPPEAFIAAMEARIAASPAPSDLLQLQADLELFKLLHQKEQVERDRRFGFKATPTSGTAINVTGGTNRYKYKVTNQATDFTYAGMKYNNTAATGVINEIDLGCDISDTQSGNNYFGFGKPDNPEKEQRFIRLATALCPTQPKFPSLYYLFPKYNHNHQGTAVGAAIPNAVLSGVPADYLQPGANATDTNAEPYIADVDDADGDGNRTELEPYIADPAAGVNRNYTYTVLQDTGGTIPGVEDGSENGIAKIALLPRAITTSPSAGCTANNWCVPAEATSGAAAARTNPINNQTTTATAGATANVGVSFLDKGIFDGREMMNVRLLDIDLDLLRRSNRGNDDVWLPKSGLVYAFREDAAREDGIARPRLTTWTNYENTWNTSTGDPAAANRMRVWNNPADPPVCQIGSDGNCSDPDPTWGRGISPKPIDYYPDPDRRPHGFRLRNGIDLTRSGSGSGWNLGDENNRRGLSFISDNSVYIQGDFNPHLIPDSALNANNLLEEFTSKLANASTSNYASMFYGRTKAQLDTDRFSQPDKDSWRPAEIIADAVGVLSSNFCDGNIQGGIRNSNAGCTNTGSTSSYQNSHLNGNPSNLRATTSAEIQGYVCENPFDIRSAKVQIGTANLDVAGGAADGRRGCDGPVKVFRNGDIQYNSTNPAPNQITTYTNYLDFTQARPINNTAGPNWVNAVIVSGTLPSRNGQSNGGLVNFPRFLESWDPTRYAPNSNSSRPLWFSGAMIQLNFSNYATGPWDQDAWETSQNALPGSGATNERIRYYTPPLRNWGYDVGLQYAPAGPVAKRMVNPSRDRSEVYREPKANNPYICLLRDAINYPCN